MGCQLIRLPWALTKRARLPQPTCFIQVGPAPFRELRPQLAPKALVGQAAMPRTAKQAGPASARLPKRTATLPASFCPIDSKRPGADNFWIRRGEAMGGPHAATALYL